MIYAPKHDSTALKHPNLPLLQCSLVADKVYADVDTEINLQVKGVQLLTPHTKTETNQLFKPNGCGHALFLWFNNGWKVSGAVLDTNHKIHHLENRVP